MTRNSGLPGGSSSTESTTEPPPAAVVEKSGEPFLGRTSLRLRMRLINSIFAAGIIAFTLITHYALQVQLVATDELIRLNEAEEYAQDADRLHDSLRGDLYAALLAPQTRGAEADQFVRTWQAEIGRFRDDLEHQAALILPPDVAENVNDLRQKAEEFLIRTEDMLELADSEERTVVAQLPDFEDRFLRLGGTFANLNSLLSQEIEGAKARAATARDEADRSIVMAAVIIIGGSLLLTGTISYSIRRSVHHVSAVARALAAGQLDVRYEQGAIDEVGAIGASLNTMADSLQTTMRQMRSDSKHDRFTKQLTEAFEIADSEVDVATVVSRAMPSVSREAPMELLLADSSQASLQRATEHPFCGGPGCKVETPAKCVAVRRGNAVSYPDSEAINACPYLHGRPQGAVAAICVPLSFMGKSLGVLHAATSTSESLSERDVVELETLALHAANRIGTVRAFQRTQTQALTDSMTGLLNRRALETELNEMLRIARGFTLLMADLDHFKNLNDTFGHQAGDRALLLFAEVIRSCMRADDRAARWGGEEFLIVLSGSSASQGVEWVDRLRTRLAERCQIAGSPKFTASIGIADSTMWPDLPGLLRIADTALYSSKRGGRDRCTVGSADFALVEDESDAEVTAMRDGLRPAPANDGGT